MLISLFQEEIDYFVGRMEVKEIFDDHIDFLEDKKIVRSVVYEYRLWLFEKD